MIDFEQLVRLALDELDEAEATEIDEHVLRCGACASTLERLVHIRGGVRDLVLAGKLAFPAGTVLIDELTAAGLISRTYRLAPGEVLPCAVDATDVYALTTLRANLDGVMRVDVVQSTPAGSTRMMDVPFDAEQGLVSFVSRSDVLRSLPSTRLRLEVFAVDGSDERTGQRKIAEYFLEHTASPPQ